MPNALSQRVKVKSVYPYVFEGIAKTTDYTLTENDYAVGVNCASGDVVITVKSASTILSYPRKWMVKKMGTSTNKLTIKLEVPSDSMYGTEFPAMRLSVQGEGIDIILNANGKYTFNSADGVAADYIVNPLVSTLTPSLASTTLTLTLNGELADIGVETSVNVRFRYRDDTAGTGWVETSDAAKTAVGAYSDTATVTAAHVYQAQAIVESAGGAISYGEVLATSIDFYGNTGIALANGLRNYWAFQETSGTDTLAVDTMGGLDMVMSGGVTIGSDTINSNTIYKRLFRANDYGQAPFTEDLSAHSHTLLVQVDMNTISGDHTLFSMGRNVLSVASDGTSIQLEVNGNSATWLSATPFSGIVNMFIVNDLAANTCTLYTATSSAVTQRISVSRMATKTAVFLRLGRGASGDSNHQDFEYLDDGDARSIAIWDLVLTAATMKAICGILDTDGGLIVR